MVPVKFEEHIREKLEQRNLKPSTEAWKKLESKLDQEEYIGSNERKLWLNIAASIVGAFLVVTFFIKSNSYEVIPTIVDTEDVNLIESDQLKNNTPDLDSNSMVDKDGTDEKDTNMISTTKVVSTSNEKKKNEIVYKEEDQITQNETEQNELSNAISESSVSKEIMISKKVDEVVAQIRALQGNEEFDSDSEIDSLLNAAQTEIKLNKLYKEALKKVDAKALLQDVEYDLDKSFRDKVFDALKSSYKTVKTAVADRNN